MDDLKQKAISGIRWVAVTSIVRRVLGFAVIVVLARLLEPADFGLFALAFVLIDALGLFQSLGLDDALIQYKGDAEAAANTVFWMIPVMGILLFGAAQLVAPWFGSWMNNTEIVPVVRWLGAIFVVSCFGRVPLAMLSRRTLFGRREGAQLGGDLIYSIVAVVLAISGWRIWSLVAAYLTKVVTINMLAWILSGWRPSLQFSWKVAGELFRVGGFLAASNVVSFVKRGVGDLLVGKLLGLTALGYYTIALGIGTFMSRQVFGRMMRVMFSVMARMQDDRARIKRAYLKYFRYIGLIALPIGIGLTLLAEPFMVVVYGAKWAPAAPLLQLLALAGVMGALRQPALTVFDATGRTRATFLLRLIWVGLFLALVIPLTELWGAVGTALASLVTNTVVVMCAAWGVRRVFGVRLADMASTLRAPLVGAMALIVAVVGVWWMLPLFGGWLMHPGGTLLVLVGSGAMCYLAYLGAVERNLWTEAKTLLQ